MGDKTLNEKQLKFVEYYIGITNCNATKAAILAGYSKNSARQMGSENLSKPYIKNVIDKKLAEIEDSLIMDRNEILKLYTSLARGEVEEDVVVTVNTGDFCSEAKVVQKKICASDRLKAAKELAKRFGLDKPESVLKAPPVVVINALPGSEKIGGKK